MKVLFQTTDFKPSKKIIHFATKKVQALERVHERIVEAHVHLKKIKSATPENKVCEIRLAIPGNDLFASKKSSFFEEAVTKTIDAIRRQINDRKIDNRATVPLEIE